MSRPAWRRALGLCGLAAALLAVLLLARPLPAQGPGAVRLAYAGFLGSAQIIRMDVDLELAPDMRLPDRYRMAVRIGTTEELKKLLPFDMQADAKGAAGQAGVQPALFTSNTRLFQSNESVTLAYDGDGEVEITSDPPTAEARRAEREGLARATLDPLSATVAMMNSVLTHGTCTGRFPVFDGVRRYDLHVTAVGVSKVTRLGFSLYEGDATECSVRTELLAGFREADVKAGVYPETSTLWLAPVFGEASLVPVRVATRSVLGPMRIDLVEAEILPGGLQ